MVHFKNRQKKLIKWILTISGVLFLINSTWSVDVPKNLEIFRLFNTFLLGFIVISYIIYLSKKTRLTFQTTLISSILFFALNTALTSESAYFEWHSYQLSKIYEIRTCQLAEQAFNKDLENGDLRYFTFGIGSDKPTENYLKKEYNLRVWHMGCFVDQPLVCYNKMVEKHVTNQLDIEFWAFLDEPDK